VLDSSAASDATSWGVDASRISRSVRASASPDCRVDASTDAPADSMVCHGAIVHRMTRERAPRSFAWRAGVDRSGDIQAPGARPDLYREAGLERPNGRRADALFVSSPAPGFSSSS